MRVASPAENDALSRIVVLDADVVRQLKTIDAQMKRLLTAEPREDEEEELVALKGLTA